MIFIIQDYIFYYSIIDKYLLPKFPSIRYSLYKEINKKINNSGRPFIFFKFLIIQYFYLLKIKVNLNIQFHSFDVNYNSNQYEQKLDLECGDVKAGFTLNNGRKYKLIKN